MVDPVRSSEKSANASFQAKHPHVRLHPPHVLHAHKHGDAKHSHSKEISNQHLLAIALLLTLSFSGVEAAAAYFAGSLALLSDAGHMVTDAAALGLALLAQIVAKRPPSPRHSFGFGRAEALAAFVNGIGMLFLVGWIIIEAVSRFFTPHQIDGMTVSVVAAIGLLMNIVVAWVLSRDKKSVNTRAALIHVRENSESIALAHREGRQNLNPQDGIALGVSGKVRTLDRVIHTDSGIAEQEVKSLEGVRPPRYNPSLKWTARGNTEPLALTVSRSDFVIIHELVVPVAGHHKAIPVGVA